MPEIAERTATQVQAAREGPISSLSATEASAAEVTEPTARSRLSSVIVHQQSLIEKVEKINEHLSGEAPGPHDAAESPGQGAMGDLARLVGIAAAQASALDSEIEQIMLSVSLL